MKMRTIMIIAIQEMRLAMRNRWLLSFAVLYTLMAGTIVFFSSVDAGRSGFEGFNRMTASLLNLSLYLVPIITLMMGGASMAGDKEDGSLGLTLTYPVNVAEVVVGKYVGMALALLSVISFGYGLAAVLMCFQTQTGSFHSYLLFALFTYLLTLMTLSISMLLGGAAGTRMQAFGVSILAWATLVFLLDFIVMALLLIVSKQWMMPILSLSVFLNPVSLIRVWTILLSGGGTILGAGLYDFTTWAQGPGGVAVFSLAALCWCSLPLAGAAFALKRRRTYG